MTTSTFAPSVVIDGQTVQPPGWMWVLGFAFGGCDWAIKEADTPVFKQRIRDWMIEQKRANIEAEITKLEERLAKLRAELATL